MKTYIRLSPPAAFGALLLIAVTYIVNAMDRLVFPTLLPTVVHEYGFTLATGGFLATIFTLGLGVGGIPGGYLFERRSRKLVAILGIVIYSGCTILTCVSFGFFDMAIYRAVSGVGEAFQNVAIFTMAGAYFTHNRTLAFGVLNIAYGLGSFIGPRWGAHLLAETASWRLPLCIYGVIGLFGAIILLLFVSKRFTEQHLEDPRDNIGSEHHIPDRLINRNTILVTLASVGGGLAAYGYLGLYPTYLQTELHFSLEASGAAASMYGAGALLGLVCGYLADRISQKYLTIVTLVALGAIGYSIFNIATTPLSQGVLSFLEGTAFSGFLFINNYSLMQRSVRSRVMGRASGLMLASINLPAALSGYLFAQLVGWLGWSTAALIQMSMLLMIPAIAMLLFDPAKTTCKAMPDARTRALSPT
jgi:MFS family permease